MPITRLNSSRDFFRIWFYWKHHAILVFLIIVGVITGYAYLATPIYESKAKLMLLPRTGEGAVITSGNQESRIHEVSQQDINTEIELLTSSEVIRDTVSSFYTENKSLNLRVKKDNWYEVLINHAKRALKEILIFLRLKKEIPVFEAKVNLLKNSLKVEPVALSNVILVKLKAENPKAAAVVLNRLLDTFIKHHNQVFSKDEGAAFYGDQANYFKTELGKTEQQLLEYQSRWHIVDLQKQNQTNIEQLSKLNEDLRSVRISIDEAQSKIALLKKGFSSGVRVTKEIKKIPTIIELEKALVPLYIQRSEILQSFTSSSREHKNIEDQIKMIQQEIRNEVKKAIETEELELENLINKSASLEKNIKEMQILANDINQKAKALNEMERNIEFLKNNYLLYTSKAQDALIFTERKQRNFANISIADIAKPSELPIFPNRLLFILLGIFVGNFAAVSMPFILEFVDHRIKHVHDVEELLSLPVISTIPANR